MHRSAGVLAKLVDEFFRQPVQVCPRELLLDAVVLGCAIFKGANDCGDGVAADRSLVRVSGRAHILRNVQSAKDEKDAARRYEEAEEAFLAAIRTGDGRGALIALADDVAAQAEAWNAAADAAYHASESEQRSALDQLTERTEVLQQLWLDIAGAFHGRAALRDG